jgi:hypothetical protein
MDWKNASQSSEGKNVLLRFKRYGKTSSSLMTLFSPATQQKRGE